MALLAQDRNICVVGTGSAGSRHLRNLQLLGCKNLLAVSEYSKRHEVIVGKEHVPTVDNYDEALQCSDIIVIANPSSLHYEYLEKAIELDKHVYVEKPVALTPQGLPRLVSLAEKKDLTVAVGTQFRFNPRLLELKALVDSGSLGQVLSVFATSGEHIADYHPGENYRNSYAVRKELGGGVLLTQIHQIDYLNWIFGDFTEVYANELRIPDLEIDVEACVSYNLLAKLGFSVQSHLNYAQKPKFTGLTVSGTLLKAEWLYEENRLTLTDNDGNIETYENSFDRNVMFFNCMEDFLRSIDNRTAPRCTLRSGHDALKVVAGIKDALSNRRIARIRN